MNDINNLINEKEYENLIDQINDLQELNNLNSKIIGKNGILTNALKELSKLDITERKEKGYKLNIIKENLLKKINKKKDILEQKTKKDNFDYSVNLNKTNLGENDIKIGKRHIFSMEINRINSIFKNAGFEFANGPDIEDIYYNFEALNIPENHPARDNHDTFYMKEQNKLLRTHTTSVQIRLLEELNGKNIDLRSYSIGRVYRNDSHDATHASSFHQVEGVILEEGVNMQHLKGFLEYFLEEFFEQKTNIRFRPSYFPFTEPSCEVDIFTKQNNGKLEVTTKEEGKPLELGGCGIIHPNILKKFKQESKQAFAFGMGLERLIMIKYGIKNLHDLYENHIPTLRYISQL